MGPLGTPPGVDVFSSSSSTAPSALLSAFPSLETSAEEDDVGVEEDAPNDALDRPCCCPWVLVVGAFW